LSVQFGLSGVKGISTDHQKEDTFMKTLTYAVVLLSFVGFSLLGCADKSQSPVAPTDQAAQGAASLEKCNVTNITLADSPIWVTPTPDVELVRGRIWKMKKVEVHELVTAKKIPSGNPYPLGSGIMVHYLSATFDAITGEGPVHGSFTITPDNNAAKGGVWEGTYVGYRFKTKTQDVYTLPLLVEGRGRGGTIQGMHMFVMSTLTVKADPVTHLPLKWTGIGTGFIK
jgi:hypothetical protein